MDHLEDGDDYQIPPDTIEPPSPSPGESWEIKGLTQDEIEALERENLKRAWIT